MIAFRILLGIDVLAAAVVLFFFCWGLSDGTVSEFNIVLWMAMLGGVAAILGGGLWLKANGQAGLASVVLLLLAIPSAGLGLFMLALIVLQPSFH